MIQQKKKKNVVSHNDDCHGEFVNFSITFVTW